MRLIDADALKKAIKTECNPYGKPTIDFESGKKVLKLIDNAPTVVVNNFKVIDCKTGKEADTEKIALKEDWAKHLIYCDIEGWFIGEDGCLILADECGNFAYADSERFIVTSDDAER